MTRRPRPPEEKPPFAVALRAARDRRGWTQDELADASDVDQAVISKYERGVLAPPRRDVVERIARALATEETDEDQGRRAVNALLLAAGFAPAGNGEYDDPLESITQEVGYSDVPLDDDQRRQLRQSVDAVVIGFMEQQKKARRKT